jgi:hypothetical protein
VVAGGSLALDLGDYVGDALLDQRRGKMTPARQRRED